MNYWVYKCNTRGEAVGNNQWGDWKDVFDDSGGVSDWGDVSYIPDLARPKKGDRVIAHQTDRHMLVGVAEVLGLRNGEFRVRPLERIGADMRALKKQHASVAAIPAYQGGPIRSIYDISNADAERLLRFARASVASRAKGGSAKKRQRLAGALAEIAAVEDDGAVAGKGDKTTKVVGQGFGLTPKERRAVERRAVELATDHFRSQGWVVEDVGDRESFDLCCRRKGVELHVEVKGTTGRGQKVILPRNEVEHARKYAHVALVVAHGVKLRKGKNPRVSGGALLVQHPWRIAAKDLEPLAYYYAVG